jgi:hypothetical protein
MTNTEPGRLLDPDTWRDVLTPDVMAALIEWTASQAFDVIHRRWLKGGSGAVVAVVLIQSHAGRQQGAILKLLPPDIAAAESRGVALAHESSPPAFRQHLVPTVSAGQLGGTSWSVHMQRVAQVDMATLVPLTEFAGDSAFSDYVGVVSEAVVNEWKRDVRTDSPMSTPADYLSNALGDHLGSDGFLRRFARRVGLDVDRPAPTVHVPGRGDMPNPLALVRGSLGSDIGRIAIFTGNGHGDLNLGNVLLPVTHQVEADRFLLVDLGRFSPHTPVARDPMKLLLSVAQVWLPMITHGTAYRSNLVEQTVMPWAFSVAPQVVGFRAISDRIHAAGHRWAGARDLSHEWTSHRLLILIDAALRTVGRDGQSTGDAWWYFEVAALATRVMLDPGAVRVGPVTTPPSSTPTPRRRTGFSADQKLSFVLRLSDSWPLLATALDIDPYTQSQWPKGREPEHIWSWLEARQRLPQLPGALTKISRTDLAGLLDGDQPPE